MSPAVSHPDPGTGSSSRSSALKGFAVFALFIAFGVGGFMWWRHTGGVRTDAAFVRSDVAQVTSEVGGRVVEVLAEENGRVNGGAVVLRIDAEPYRLRLGQAQSALVVAQAGVVRSEGSADAASAQVRLARAQLADAEREASLQEKLVAAGSSVESRLERARSAVKVAREAVSAASEQAAAAQAAKTAAEAQVAAAQSALALAERDVAHTEVTAPTSGTSTRVTVVPGDFVRPGQPLFAVVPDETYVVANFKETQLPGIQVGDLVDVWVDAYPEVGLSGRVHSIGAGTSAAFSLLPADNPSGNFVKVVQRVPVRIELDQREAGGRPLTVGLSAFVSIRAAGNDL